MFFDSAVADALQPLAVLVEAAGFTLIVLDIYAPVRAQQLEGAIQHTAAFLTTWKDRDRPEPARTSLTAVLTGAWLLLVPARAVFMLATWFVLGPVRLALRGLDRLAKGHALAGLGLVLAFLALTLELYQLGALCAAGSCGWG